MYFSRIHKGPEILHSKEFKYLSQKPRLPKPDKISVSIIKLFQVQVRQVHVGNNQIGGTTRLVMGSDQNGPKYTVQETVIDGKKTLILDHNDLARLLQSNNGNAVVLHQGVNISLAQNLGLLWILVLGWAILVLGSATLKCDTSPSELQYTLVTH